MEMRVDTDCYNKFYNKERPEETNTLTPYADGTELNGLLHQFDENMHRDWIGDECLLRGRPTYLTHSASSYFFDWIHFSLSQDADSFEELVKVYGATAMLAKLPVSFEHRHYLSLNFSKMKTDEYKMEELERLFQETARRMYEGAQRIFNANRSANVPIPGQLPSLRICNLEESAMTRAICNSFIKSALQRMPPMLQPSFLQIYLSDLYQGCRHQPFDLPPAWLNDGEFSTNVCTLELMFKVDLEKECIEPTAGGFLHTETFLQLLQQISSFQKIALMSLWHVYLNFQERAKDLFFMFEDGICFDCHRADEVAGSLKAMVCFPNGIDSIVFPTRRKPFTEISAKGFLFGHPPEDKYYDETMQMMVEPSSTALRDTGFPSPSKKKIKAMQPSACNGRGLKILRLHDVYIIAKPFLIEDDPKRNTFKVRKDSGDVAYLSRYLCVPGLEEFVFSRPTITDMEARTVPEDRGWGSPGHQVQKEKQMMQYELLVCLEQIRSGLAQLSESKSNCALTKFQLTVDWYNAWPFLCNEERLGCLCQYFDCLVLDALGSADDMDGLWAATGCMEALGRMSTVESLTLTYHYDLGLDFLARSSMLSNKLKSLDVWVSNKYTTHPSRIARMLEAASTRLSDMSIGYQLEKLIVAVNSLDSADPLKWNTNNYYDNKRKLIFESKSEDDEFASRDFFLMPTSARIPQLATRGREAPEIPVANMFGSPRGIQITQYVLAEDVSLQFAHAVHERTVQGKSKLAEVQVRLPHFLTIEFMEQFLKVILYGSLNGYIERDIESPRPMEHKSSLRKLVVLGGIQPEQTGRVPVDDWIRLNKIIVSNAFDMEEFHWPAHELFDDIAGKCNPSERNEVGDEITVLYQVYNHLDLVRRRCALNKAKFWEYSGTTDGESDLELLAKVQRYLDQEDDYKCMYGVMRSGNIKN